MPDALEKSRLHLTQIWKKIPFLGKRPFGGTPAYMTNEERAFDAGGANKTLPFRIPAKEE